MEREEGVRLEAGASRASASLALAHLCFRQAEAVGQLLPLGSDHVMVLLEGSLQTQELGRREGRADALGFPGKGAVEQQAVLGHVGTCIRRQKRSGQCRSLIKN